MAFLVACAVGAWAQSAASADTRTVTPVSLSSASTSQSDEASALRPAQGAPRYSAQIPPSREEAAPSPAAAPTAKVDVQQVTAPAAQADAPQPVSQPTTPPRYTAQGSSDERITVTALRGSEDGLYRLGTGDKLRITVFNEADLSGEFTIDGQGYVRLPLIGQVPAAGLTSFGLESRIGEKLAGGGYLVNPRVAVEVTTYRPFYILGEVAKPGEYPYVNGMSVPNAIALAGGYTDRAVTSTIYIRRQGENDEQALEADETTPIHPGDVVRVRRTVYWTVMTWLAPIFSPFATAAYMLK